MKTITVITPCFNEQENVLEHYRQVQAVIKPYTGKYEFDFIYTDNQSNDATFLKLSEIARQDPRVKVYRFSRNIGAEPAIRMGYQHAKGDAVIIIQADLQDPPELIPQFIQKWEEGFDVVYGAIRNREDHSVLHLFRKWHYRLVKFFADHPIALDAGEFRLMSRRAVDALMNFKERDLYIRGIIGEIGFPQLAIPYDRAPRKHGKTSTNFFFLFGYALNGIFSTSTLLPVRLLSFVGFLAFFIGMGMMVFIAASKFIFPGVAPKGFTMMGCLLAFFSGIQMLSIGILGEYIRRIYLQTLNRPVGFVQDRINDGE